jgi:hypothetical protein
MSPQVGLVNKTSCAEVTRKWVLARVDSKVDLQKSRPGKALATNVLFAGKGMVANMHLECRD